MLSRQVRTSSRGQHSTAARNVSIVVKIIDIHPIFTTITKLHTSKYYCFDRQDTHQSGWSGVSYYRQCIYRSGIDHTISSSEGRKRG